MPEYPEVYTVIKKIKSIFLGAKIKSLEVRLSKIFPFYNSELSGTTISKISQKGKYIIFHTHPYALIVHLRMEGKFYSSFDNIEPSNKHIHIVIKTDKGDLYYHDTRQFGKFYLRSINTYESEKPLNVLGPTPYDINPNDFLKSLQRRNIPIKQLLLDQTVMAGLGNIYANEVLFACGINPFKQASSLTAQNALDIISTSKRILDESIKLGGTTIHSFSSMGEAGKFQTKLVIHGKAGQSCPRCGQTIIKKYINGRGTYYCDRCQK